MFAAMPAPLQIYAGVPSDDTCPLTVREGRNWLNKLFEKKQITYSKIEHEKKELANDVVIQMKDVWFKYEKNGPDIVSDLSLTVRRGEWFSIVGGNGTARPLH